MNENTTNEFSFILKPSEHGIGVFAIHNIAKGAKLVVFPEGYTSRSLHKDKVPDILRGYCIDRENDRLTCPYDFSHMPIGWYLNHSNIPNAEHRNYVYYASRDIKEGEEILIDYNTLEEPEDSKDDYYKN